MDIFRQSILFIIIIIIPWAGAKQIYECLVMRRTYPPMLYFFPAGDWKAQTSHMWSIQVPARVKNERITFRNPKHRTLWNDSIFDLNTNRSDCLQTVLSWLPYHTNVGKVAVNHNKSFMLRSYTATCFDSGIRRHHQTEKLLQKTTRSHTICTPATEISHYSTIKT